MEVHGLLTAQEAVTLTGAVTVVFLGAQSLHYAFGWAPRSTAIWLSLMMATYGALHGTGSPGDSIFLIIPNSFIIYSTAAGFAHMSTATSSHPPKAPPPGHVNAEEMLHDPGRRPFFSPWFN